MTPEEFNKEFAIIEKVIGCPCPAPVKQFIWATCKNEDVGFLKRSLTIYKINWDESNKIRELKRRHRYS